MATNIYLAHYYIANLSWNKDDPFGTHEDTSANLDTSRKYHIKKKDTWRLAGVALPSSFTIYNRDGSVYSTLQNSSSVLKFPVTEYQFIDLASRTAFIYANGSWVSLNATKHKIYINGTWYSLI